MATGTLATQTIAASFKALLKAGSNYPVALASGSGSSERLVFGEDDAADVRTALYVTQDRLGLGTATPDNLLELSHNVTSTVTTGNVFDNTLQGIHIAKTGTNDGAGSMLKFSADGDTNQAAIVHQASNTSRSELPEPDARATGLLLPAFIRVL